MNLGDFETRSRADLKKVGAWAYSEHPSTDIICFCWQFAGSASVHRWWPDWLNMPEGESRDSEALEELHERIMRGELFEAHNVAFEFSVWNNVAVPRYGWPELDPRQCRDSMAVASYYALPTPLEKLSRTLGLGGKDPEGGRLITKYSKLHLKTARSVIPPEDALKFVNYCVEDVKQEQQVGVYLGELPYDEELVFLHDFNVNVRGLHLDIVGIGLASDVVDRRSEELEERFREITKLRPGQRDKFLAWCAERGMPLENLQSEYVEEVLGLTEESLAPWNDELANPIVLPTGEVAEALRIRLQHSRASTKKLDGMAQQCGKDGRARFQTRYHGAVTGRNTGTGFQPLNLPRGFEEVNPNNLVRDISYANPRWLDTVYGDAMAAVSAATRHWITAERGNRLLAGDFASVEAVVLAVLAGEEWKVELFKNREPVYERTADKIYKLPPGTVTKKTHPHERQDGKTCELAFGYQGALGAWRKFDSSDRHDDASVIKMVKAWRAENAAIVDFWYGLNAAAMEATIYRGRTTSYGPIGFEFVDGWLTMILPNGKRLWYWDADVRMVWPQEHLMQDYEHHDLCALGECDHKQTAAITYMTYKGGAWKKTVTYGGKLAENAVQATCREVLKHCEIEAEAEGYPVILSVYDEIVTEVPYGQGTLEEFQAIMEDLPAWATGWPIRAEVWEGERYKK